MIDDECMYGSMEGSNFRVPTTQPHPDLELHRRWMYSRVKSTACTGLCSVNKVTPNHLGYIIHIINNYKPSTDLSRTEREPRIRNQKEKEGKRET